MIVRPMITFTFHYVIHIKYFIILAYDVKMQFGKTGPDSFICDFSYPFSPMLAFGIALTNFNKRY